MFDNFKRKAMALLLSLAMIITYMPASMVAYAEGVDDQVQVEQQAEAEAPAEDVEAPKAEQPEEKAPAEDVEAPKAEQPEEKASEEVKSEEAKPDETKSEEAAPAEKKASEASEDAAKPADEEVKEDAKAKVEDKEPIVYTEDLETVAVKVTAPADAFSEKVKLVVKPLEKNSDEFKEAEEALEENKQTYDGILAFDIHFENAGKKEIEPEGPVSVEMTAKKEAFKGVDAGTVDAESFEVVHIGEKVEVVADTDDNSKVDGTVDVSSTDTVVKAIDVAFEVDNFSTFVLKWNEESENATIHWGTYDGSTFTEFDSTTVVDVTAPSTDLAVNIDKYYYVGARYFAPGSTDGVSMDTSVIKKNGDNGWTVDTKTETTKETVQVVDGSDIYVYYAEKGSGGYTPPPAPSGDIEDIAPETKKTVKPNGDGTYNIRLDVEGNATDDVKVGANVIVILDMTQSMTERMGGGDSTRRIDAAKGALRTLINTLDPDTNPINLTVSTFGNTMTVNNVLPWTDSKTEMLALVNGNALNNPNAYGTNWQAGLQGGRTLVEQATSDPDLKKNATYVLFVTDGAPNCWQGHTTSETAGNLDERALAPAQVPANWLGSNSNFYGIFCGNASGHDNLANLVSAAGGVDTINGTSTSGIQEAFGDIAGQILEGIGASNVTVDDGIPSLSNISANITAGEAGGFTYYIKPAGEAEREWVEGATGTDDKGAPGATYDESNGVTWDIGEAGTLKRGWVYSVEFTVWPSQDAYDTIADLNNGIKEMTQAELDAAGIGKTSEGKYYLLTNTHLNTTFTDPAGNTYNVVNKDVTEQMKLPTDTISVQKIWNNFLDQQNPPAGMKLILQKDGEDYLSGDNAIEVSSATGWKHDNIYISVGQIRGTGANYEILETGHDYKIVEPEDMPEGSYRWELTSEIYHPMVINGIDTMLIRDDDATGTDGVDYYTFKGHKYVKSDGTANTLKAWNDRRSWLQIEKKDVTGTGAPADALFEYTVTINDANKENVWYSAFNSNEIITDLETNGTAEVDEETGDKTGYYYVTSGTAVTVKLQKGWTLRFLNLPSGTTYTVEETGFPDGFAFDSAADRQVVDTAAQQDAPARPTITGAKATGTINVPNVEFYVDYNNKYELIDIEFTKVWDDGNDQDGIRPSAAEFANYISLLVNGKASTAYDGKRTITDKGDGTYTIKYTGVPNYINGKEAKYQLSESVIEKYNTTGNPAEVNGTITNTHEPETVDIPATKTFADATVVTAFNIKKIALTLEKKNDDGTWSPVTDHTKVEVEVATDGTWTYIFENLPKYAAGGGAIAYRVVEDAVYVQKEDGSYVDIKSELGLDDEDAFIASPGTSDNDYTLQNTRNKGYLKLTKSLASDSDQVTIPDDTTFTITGPADYGTNGSMTVTYADIKDGNYVVNVPTGTYEVVEDTASAAVSGYTLAEPTYSPEKVVVKTTSTRDNPAALEVINKYKANTYDLEVTKTFEGNEGNLPDGTEPYAITVTYKDVNNATQTKTLQLDDEGAEVTAGQSYKWTVSGVRYGTEATATEANTAITGYTLDTEASTVDGRVNPIAVSGNKIELKNVYTRDIAGLEIEKVVANAATNETNVTAKQIGKATFEIKGPADYNNGEPKQIIYEEDFTNGVYTEQVPTGEYTVVEVEGSANVTGFSVVTTYTPETGKTNVTKDGGKVTVTNTYTQKFDDEEDEVNKPSFTVIKKDQDGAAMSGVKFTLTGSDSFKSEKTTGTDGKAAFDFNDFDFGEDSKGAATEEFEFTLTEEAPTGYTGAGPWTIKVGEDGDVIDIELNEETGYWHHIWNWVIEHFTKSGEEADTSEWDGEKLELTVVNQINTYDLEVTKTFEGNEGNLPDGTEPYAITVTYKDVNNATQTKTLQLDDEGAEVTAGQSYKWTVSGVRYGTEATATEANTAISGYTLDTEASTVDGRVNPIAVSGNKIELKNVYTHANLVINKTIDKLVSYDADEEVKDATFTFRIVGKNAAGKTVLNTVAAVMFNAETGTSNFVTINKIPADITEMTVTEIDSGNYISKEIAPESGKHDVTEGYTTTWTFSFDNTQNGGDYESGAINRYKKDGTGYVKDGGAPAQTEEGGAGDSQEN